MSRWISDVVGGGYDGNLNGGDPDRKLVCPAGAYLKKIYGGYQGGMDGIMGICSDGTNIGGFGSNNNDYYYLFNSELDSSSVGFNRARITNNTNYGDPLRFDAYGVTTTYVDPSKPKVMSNARIPPNTTDIECPAGQVITGLHGASVSRNGHNVAGKLGIVCDYNPKDYCSYNPIDPYCQDVYASNYADNQFEWQTSINKYCGQAFATGTDAQKSACKAMIMKHPGDFDQLMNNYCTGAGKSDPACACFQPIDPNASEAVKAIQGKPQCYNQKCAVSGYQTSSMLLNRTCPNITVCTQELNGTTAGAQLSQNVVTQDCSTHASPSSGGSVMPPSGSSGSSLFTASNIFWMVLILIIAAIIGAVVYFSGGDEAPAYPAYA
jgi:hypothetical protein